MYGPETRFLVVDDFSTMRRIIRNLLKELGYHHIIEADDGQSALAQLDHGAAVDIVLTDWNMPQMDGVALLHAIRTTPKLMQLPVIMVTAEARKENIIIAAQAGADGYIVKPFTGATLAEKLTKVYARRNPAAVAMAVAA